MGKYGIKEVPEWNINQAFSEILKELIIELNRSAQAGDVRAWFNNCRVLFRNIYGHDKVNNEVLIEVDALMQKTATRLNYLPEMIQPMALTNEQKKVLSGVKRYLDEINILLMNEMYVAGLIFPISKKDVKYSGLEVS